MWGFQEKKLKLKITGKDNKKNLKNLLKNLWEKLQKN